MKREHDLESVKEHIEELVGNGAGRYTAVAIAVGHARGRFKSKYPEKTILPKHLMPGTIKHTYLRGEDNG